MSNTYVILKENSNIINEKCHDLLNIYFKNNYNVLYLSCNNSINFLCNNSQNKDIKIIFNILEEIDDAEDYKNNLLDFIQSNIFYCKIFFILFDWWKIRDDNHIKQNIFMEKIYNANNYKVISYSNNIEQLNSYFNKNFNTYKENILHINLWSSYNTSFINFNENPIEKILLSGATSFYYPERITMLNINNVIYYEYNNNDITSFNNNYNQELNKYIACFTSSVYIYNETENRIKNTNLILLKTFEILASGALLLMPYSEEIYLQKIGIINGENCILLDFDKCLNEQINNILNINNRININNIRYNGYLHAKNNLTTDKKFNEFNALIN